MNNLERNSRYLILNGVNLGSLGTREVNIYGSLSFDEYLQKLRQAYPSIDIHFEQMDNEGDLAAAITSAKGYAGIILNAGAYTHTSVVVADAVRTTSSPVVEVHISNLYGREQYRRESVLSSCCHGFISGFGLDSYRLALEALLKINSQGH